MAPTLFASAILALRKPANKQKHWLKSVKAPRGQTEPRLKDVYAAVKKVWGMGRGDSIEALICDTSTRLAARGSDLNKVVLIDEFDPAGNYKLGPDGVRLLRPLNRPQNRVNAYVRAQICGGDGHDAHDRFESGKWLVRRQADDAIAPKPAEWAAGMVVGAATSFDGPAGPIVLTARALLTCDFDGVVAAKCCVMDSHEKKDPSRRSFSVTDRDQLIEQSKVGSVDGLLFTLALLRERGDPGESITFPFRRACLTTATPHELAVLEMMVGIGNIVGDAGIATGDSFGTTEFACGGVAKAFKEAIANAGAGADPFPPDGANNRQTPGRVRANALARAIKALPTPEKERIWRRARMYQT